MPLLGNVWSLDEFTASEIILIKEANGKLSSGYTKRIYGSIRNNISALNKSNVSYKKQGLTDEEVAIRKHKKQKCVVGRQGIQSNSIANSQNIPNRIQTELDRVQQGIVDPQPVVPISANLVAILQRALSQGLLQLGPIQTDVATSLNPPRSTSQQVIEQSPMTDALGISRSVSNHNFESIGSPMLTTVDNDLHSTSGVGISRTGSGQHLQSFQNVGNVMQRTLQINHMDNSIVSRAAAVVSNAQSNPPTDFYVPGSQNLMPLQGNNQ